MADINIECPPIEFNSSIDRITFKDVNDLTTFVVQQLKVFNNSDPIYCFVRSNLDKSLTLYEFNADAVVVISGSKAVKFLATLLNKSGNWEAKDADVFFLNSNSEFRYDLEAVDIVAKTAKDVASLLAGFDLPCCRVAYNKNFIWASLQALRAILTNKYSVPKFYQDMEIWYASKGFSCPTIMATKFYNRVAKYEQRGFAINYDMPLDKTTFIERLDPNKCS